MAPSTSWDASRRGLRAASRQMADPAGRFHNREEDSPEALRRSIDDLAQSVAALDRKLDAVTLALGAEVGGARVVTSHLATEVARMGEALVRRMDLAAARPKINTRSGRTDTRIAWFGVLTAGILLAIAGLALFPR